MQLSVSLLSNYNMINYDMISYNVKGIQNSPQKISLTKVFEYFPNNIKPKGVTYLQETHPFEEKSVKIFTL